jgi:photosystem II stability/assembly factor-like uncharacterized protein
MSFKLSNFIATALVLFPTDLLFAQWAPTNGPTGKDIRAFSTDGQALYVATNSGIFTSTNKGALWRNISNPDAGVSGLIQSMAASAGGVLIGTTSGLYRLAENGGSWIHSVPAANDSNVSCLLIKGDTTLAGTAGGSLYRSLDKGVKWSRLNPGIGSEGIISLGMSGASVFFGSYNGIFRSLDNGATWIQKSFGGVDSSVKSIVVTPDYVFARTGSGLYRSSDNGDHWNRMNTGEKPGDDFRSLNVVGSRVFASTSFEGLFRSPDNGNTWNRDSSFFNMLNTSEVREILPCENALFAAAFLGMFRSDDNGNTWIGVNTGIGLSQALSMLDLDGSRILSATNRGLFLSENKGALWLRLKSGPTPVVALAQWKEFWFSGDENGEIYRSSDQGATWVLSNIDPKVGYIGKFYTGQNGIYALAGSGVLLGSTDGISWGLISDKERVARCMAESNGALLVGSTTGLWRYSNSSWDSLKYDFGPNGINALISDGPIVIAGNFSGRLYRSSDYGNSWTIPLDSNTISNPTCFALRQADIFMGSDSGVFLSKDHGVSWNPVNTGLVESKKVVSILIQGDYLYVGLNFGGIWKRPISEMGSAGVFRNGTARQGGEKASRGNFRNGKIGFLRVGRNEIANETFDAAGRMWANRILQSPGM